MSEKYYQKYGPINRRRSDGELDDTPPPPPREPRRPSPRPRRRQRRSLAGPLLFVVCAVAFVIALPYLTNILTPNQVLQGVRLQGEPIGGMQRDVVRDQILRRYSTFAAQPITIAFEGKTWTPTADQLGIGFNIDTVTDAVVGTLRTGGPVERASGIWQLVRDGVDVAPPVSVDIATLQAYLTSLAAEVENPPQNASLSLAEGRVFPAPAQDGRQLLVDETAIDVVQALQTLQPQTITLRTRLLDPQVTNEEAQPAVDTAKAMLRAPLVLRQGERTWEWTPDRLAALVQVSAEGGTMQVNIDQARLEQAVNDLAQLVDSPSAEPRVAFRNGALQIVAPGQEGVRLDQIKAAEAISTTLQATGTLTREVQLPITLISPAITEATLPELGIVELVGEGKTSFAGSAPYRVTNIKAGAARMSGVLIAPDEEFSFNTQLGAVDETNGFVQGYAIIGNRTQLEWGGGVCQDSTTVFRAAFWAGLPITERHTHAFYISWYDAYALGSESGPGMDASIYTGALDLKFKNDTGNWLLMESEVDEVNQVMTVRLYGTKPNRTVRAVGPQILKTLPAPSTPVTIDDPELPAGTIKQTDTARKGMEIAVYRVITENGVEREPELFFTRFKAWPDVYVRGTR